MTVSARLAVAATLALVLAACGGSSGGGSASPAATSSGPAAGSASASAAAPTGAQITIANFDFGNTLTVKAGEMVSVKNSDSVGHTVTADDGKSFDASVGANATITFTAPGNPGTYKFHCTIHPEMHGTLTVTA